MLFRYFIGNSISKITVPNQAKKRKSQETTSTTNFTFTWQKQSIYMVLFRYCTGKTISKITNSTESNEGLKQSKNCFHYSSEQPIISEHLQSLVCHSNKPLTFLSL